MAAGEDNVGKEVTNVFKNMTLKEVMVMASRDSSSPQGLMKMTMNDYCVPQNGGKNFFQNSIEWRKFKDVLQRIFTDKDFSDTTGDEYSIFVSKEAVTRLAQAWKPNITADGLEEKLRASQPAAEREAKEKEEKDGLNRINSLLASPFTIFIPIAVPMALDELCAHLNESNVFNKSFVFQQKFGGKPGPHLRMICKDIDQAAIQKFIDLLDECSVNATPATDRNGWRIIAVRGVRDEKQFLDSKEKLTQFAKEHAPKEQHKRPSRT